MELQHQQQQQQQVKVPHYILISSSSRAQPIGTTAAAVPILSHPILQYHYANDRPLSLLPESGSEQVLLLDYDPLSPASTRMQSISGNAAITGIRVTDAPGAVSAEEDACWSSKMFVLETTTFESRFVRTPKHRCPRLRCFPRRVPADDSDPRAVLAQFKQKYTFTDVSCFLLVIDPSPQQQCHYSTGTRL
jgi:hypothetical protein